MFLANLIFIFHIFVILFVITTPFICASILILILHITFCFCLIIHWVNNSDSCSLTLLECYLKGIPASESFTHQFISPIYNISESSWSIICYIITIFVMLVSIYYLINCPNWNIVIDYYFNNKKLKGGKPIEYYLLFII